MPANMGVPIEEIQTGIKYGVRKINITQTVVWLWLGDKKNFIKKKSEFDPRQFLIPATKEMGKVVKQRYEQFGTAASFKIKVIPVEDMANRYQTGELLFN